MTARSRTPESALSVAILRRPAFAAATAIAALGAILAVAYFPELFNRLVTYDDEGYLLVTIRNFLEHGSLYEKTFSQYGPFYYLVMTPLYWLTGKQPTLDNGRLIVLVFTSLSSGLFAAGVWRLTRSLPWALLCQVGTFLLLVSVHGAEPMHPGSLIAVLLSVLVFSLCSYADSGRSSTLAFVGAAVGALLMTKVNVGLLAIGALTLAFVIGNRSIRPRLQAVLLAAALVSPFALVYKNLDRSWALSLALMVSLALLELGTLSLTADTVSVSRRALRAGGTGFLGAVLASIALPVATGTSIGGLIDGVLVEPLRLADINVIVSSLSFEWDVIVPTVALLAFAVYWRRLAVQSVPPGSRFPWPHAVLVGVTLWMFLSGIGELGDFGAWLLPVALLPALASTADVRPEVRLALRLLVSLAILQALHAYPVAGSQVAWATVTLAVPCTIVLAVGFERIIPRWEVRRVANWVVVTVLSFVLMLAMSLWPVDVWADYRDQQPLGLAGASLLRLDPVAPSVGGLWPEEVRGVAASLRASCDAVWSYPHALGSFYIFTDLESPSGLFVNLWPKLLDRDQKRRVVRSLSTAEDEGRRVCIIRGNAASPLGDGGDRPRDPLVSYLDGFTEPIAEFGTQDVFSR